MLAIAGRAGQAAPQTASDLYAAATAREQALRAVMDKSGARLRDYRAAIDAWDALVRRFPTSGYVDNALWQGALVAVDAFERFGEERDRSTASRMLGLLVSDYPASPFVARAREASKRLLRVDAAEEEVPAPGRAAADAAVVLRGIARTVMADRVRVTIELDGPVTYRTERVDGPPRVLFDLAGTRPGEGVPEGTLSYSDDIVRRVRVGVHPNRVTRVVVDLAGVARYSVTTLDRPYRVVIDCQRERAVPITPNNGQPVAGLLAEGLPEPWSAPPVVEPVSGEWLRVQPPPFPVAPASSHRDPAPAAPRPSFKAPPAPATDRGPYSLARQLGLGATKIVIDPGHGGHDPGALGSGASEASIVLDVAKRLDVLLRNAGVEVILTRKADEFVPLDERPAIATRVQADLFLSIHANASRNRSARGIESYVLNFATDPDAEAVAARENASTGLTIGSLPEIVRAIALNSKLDESRSFAALIQKSMAAQLGTVNRGLRNHGVKQAPFVVLIGAAMPSVLVEISFLTNAQEGRLLKSGAYRQRVAQALFEAVRGYQKSLKGAEVVSRK